MVVGVAVDDRSAAALDWATAEAAARNVPLRIVHTFTVPLLADPWGALFLAPYGEAALQAATHVLEDAAMRALAIAPGLKVTTHPRAGSTADAVMAEASDGAVIVLGSPTAHVTSARRRNTAARTLAGRTSVPLVVVSLADDPTSSRSLGRVVVGVADARRSGAALAFAFDAARRRCTGLTAVRACSSAGSCSTKEQQAATRSEQYDSLAATLLPHRLAYPDVEVRQRLLTAPATAALLDEAGGAALVVLGGRSSGWVWRRHGDIRQVVLECARAPIAIVPVASGTPHPWWRRWGCSPSHARQPDVRSG